MTGMPSVLLIRPLCAADELEFAESLGLERLAGYLRQHGVHDVAVLDRRLYVAERRAGVAAPDAGGFFADLRATYVVGGQPGWIGLSLMTSADVPDALRVMSRLRSWWPGARFVLGGGYVTHAPDEVARRFPRDITLLRGEGEAQLLELVCPTSSDVGQHATRLAVPPDEWAMPLRADLERYARLGCAVNMQTSRGCPGACAFCATPQLPRGLRRWQPRDLRLVADEIQTEARRLEHAGMPAVFNFVDDDFGPLERVEALAHVLAERGVRVAFSLEMRLASLMREPRLAERLRRLAEHGLTRVFVGVESCNPDTLARWHKRYDVGELPRVVAAFGDAGITLQTGYIMWHAHQTVEGALAEAQELWRLGIYTHQAATSRMVVFPGCALAAEGVTDDGLERLSPEAERFYAGLVARTSDLRERWLRLALAEPRVAAQAWLTGDSTALDALRAELDDVNRTSYDLLRVSHG